MCQISQKISLAMLLMITYYATFNKDKEFSHVAQY